MSEPTTGPGDEQKATSRAPAGGLIYGAIGVVLIGAAAVGAYSWLGAGDAATQTAGLPEKSLLTGQPSADLEAPSARTAMQSVAGDAAAPRELSWDDLRPSDVDSLLGAITEAARNDPMASPDPSGRLGGIVSHGGNEQSDAGSGLKLVTELEGQRVRLPGYTVPIVYGPEGSTEFLLVPFVGACVHVPPPPPNQIVHVKSDTPIAMAGLFEAVYVTGVMNLIDEDLELAQVGYRITADTVELYE